MNKDKKVMYISLISVVFLILVTAIVSITYSYYTAGVSNDADISGSTEVFDLDVESEQYSTEATGGLVPQLSDTTYLEQALSGTDNKACVDGNGNTVCQIYKITITNTSGATLNFGATLTLSGATTDLKWEVLKTSTTLNNPRVTHDASDNNLETNLLLEGNESKEYYVVVWLEETGETQTKKSTDSFTGVITIEGSSGSVSILLNDNIYHQVEYLESTGTQYINTGVYPNDNTKIRMKFNNLEATGYTIIGYYTNNNSESDIFRFFNSQSTAYLDYGSGNGHNRVIGNTNINPNTIYEVEIGNRYVKDISTNNYYLQDDEVSFQEKNYTIYVNGNNNYSKNRWYYLKIYKNDVLVRNMIPVYRVSDNKPGLYDLVNEVFYTNSGTGEFTISES